MIDTGTVEFNEVLRSEHNSINRRRERVGRKRVSEITDTTKCEPVYDTLGLALSGGGIRSAAISLGVLQALNKFRILSNVDYVSTVSGGGYIGSSLSTTLTLTRGEFVFDDKIISEPGGEFSGVAHLRNYSNYLFAGGKHNFASAVAIVTRGLVANLIIVGAFLNLVTAFTIFTFPFVLKTIPNIVGIPYFPATIVFFDLVIIGFLLWAILASLLPKRRSSIESNKISVFGAVCLSFLVAVFFIELNAQLILATIKPEPIFTSLVLAIYFSGVIGLPVLICLALFQRRLGNVLKRRERGESDLGTLILASSSRLLIWIAAAGLPLWLWSSLLSASASGVLVSYYGNDADWPLPNFPLTHLARVLPSPQTAWYLLIYGGILWLLGSLLKPNALSLHGLYRDRLKSAFLFDPTRRSNAGYVPVSEMLVSDISPDYAPYQLINAALNIRGSSYANQRGRDADFFLFSPNYVGSSVTGYVPTVELEKRQEGFDLASAVAISGAAVSSSMGTRSIRPLAPTLALFNIRLGYWIQNPRSLYTSKKFLRRSFRSAISSLLMEITGRIYTDTSNEVYVTDGGHIENLGLYELLRRRCRVIVCVDAEADPDMRFSSFVTLQRYASIDLAIEIQLPWNAIQAKTVESMGYDPLRKKCPKPISTCGPHAAIGVIHYSGGQVGFLLYIKSSLTGDEQDYVLDYARRYGDFPHEATGKQFFNEEQFEVYRALGFHVADGILSGRDVVEVAGAGPTNFSDSADPVIMEVRRALTGPHPPLTRSGVVPPSLGS